MITPLLAVVVALVDVPCPFNPENEVEAILFDDGGLRLTTYEPEAEKTFLSIKGMVEPGENPEQAVLDHFADGIFPDTDDYRTMGGWILIRSR